MTEKSLVVSGLDLAAVNSGFCKIRATLQKKKLSVTVLEYASLVPESKDFFGRLNLADKIAKMVEQSDLIALEDYARRVGSTNTTAYECGEFVGQVKCKLYRNKVPIIMIPPTSMRSFVGIKRNDPKSVVENWAEKNFGFSPKLGRQKQRSDVSDAFAHCVIASLYYFAKTLQIGSNTLDTQQQRIIFGDKKLEGLVDRPNILIGELRE